LGPYAVFFRENLSDPAHRLSANEQTNGAWLLARRATSFQPRGCRRICVYCWIGDRLGYVPFVPLDFWSQSPHEAPCGGSWNLV